MKVLLVLSLLVALAAALPQNFQSSAIRRDRDFGFGTGTRDFTSTRVGHSVSGFSGFGSSAAASHSSYTDCVRREVSPGHYEYDCSSAHPGEIVDEKVLWVPYSGSDQNLLIRVPNYAVKDIVRAASYPEGETNENIRIHVARPALHHVVEGQFEKSVPSAPNVQLSYEPLVHETEKVYGPPGQPFSPLSKRIDEQVGFRRGVVSGTNNVNGNGFGFGGSSSTFSSQVPSPSFGTTFGTRSTGFSSSRPVVSTSFSNGNSNNVGSGFGSSFLTGSGTGTTGTF
jgi:hypothetical protein